MVSPPAVLRDQLALARRRGDRFDDAWPPALAAALALVTRAPERRAWTVALDGTRGAWRHAYAGKTPTRREAAAGAIIRLRELEPHGPHGPLRATARQHVVA